MIHICKKYDKDMSKICQKYAEDKPKIWQRYDKICKRYRKDMPKISIIQFSHRSIQIQFVMIHNKVHDYISD